MMRCPLLLAVLVTFAVPSAVNAQCVKKPTAAPPAASAASDPQKYFENYPYDKQVLSTDDQARLDSDDDLYGNFVGGWAEYARIVIFGKHGRIFTDVDTQKFLEASKWYKANPKFSNSMLNPIERKNLDIVRGIEAELHDHVMPGDLRFWQDRDVPKDQPWQSSVVDLHVMRAEIEAIHGKRFDDEPWLQKYLEDRYWYEPAATYDAKHPNSL